ncbi:MMPL family transporter [Microcella alkaliphila]|uniref:Putative membrane protein ActII-3 n=1 Tax=Microcella alkaliphila TaxID=279828 RepID=A0A0U5BAV7_9MICO|nr:MMPL family transporter [Microcella alkaliphila]BAU32880.1 putative membrane protein ActII-3 [Microcella alkaliphila]
MSAYLRLITSKATSWLVLLATVLGAGALIALSGQEENDAAPPVGLPDSAESVQVQQLQEQFPSADGTSAILVVAAETGTLTDEQLATLGDNSAELAQIADVEFLPPPIVSDDATVAFVVVPLDPITSVSERAERADELRAAASADLAGATVYLTGAEGFEVDLAAVFEGANVTLLGTTVLVVAVLLILTYRSPWLWLVPLAVVGLGDQVAGTIARLVAGAVGVELDASVTGILSVLVFGAATNYALLLIARYRDELRLFEDRREAMRRAVRGTAPAILASGGTVALALATLLFAELSGNRALGLAGAIGIVVAMFFGLVVLPAALVLFSRGLFWPFVPRYGAPDFVAKSPWGRLGRRVSRRPVIVATVGFLALAGFAAGLVGANVGLSQNERFIEKPEAVVGQEVLADAFSAGSTSPAAVIVPSDEAAETLAALLALDGVDSGEVGESTDEWTQLDVTIDADPESAAAFDTIERMRASLDDVGTGQALVGGIDAQALDAANAQERDQAIVIPLILVLVFIVLVILLRALLAPLLLLGAVVASYFSAVGIGWILFQTVFGFPAIDTTVLLFSFLFLVALGIDYSIFLVTRAQEEAERLGIKEGMIRALAATGAVITSAGILLAAVFAVLGVLPLITLTQIGIIVCIGVLIDTLLVRTVIVPAFAFIAGDRFFWPRKPRVTIADAEARGLTAQQMSTVVNPADGGDAEPELVGAGAPDGDGGGERAS